MSKYLIVNASPRHASRSAQICEELQHLASIENSSSTELLVGKNPPNACTACDDCEETFSCIIDDVMHENYRALESADTLLIVTPVYFAGPPAQLKAFFDRMQPYFWSEKRKEKKRPAYLFVVREGGDPHGFEPLVSITRSSLAVAGFKLKEVFDYYQVFDEGITKTTTDAFLQTKKLKTGNDYD